MCSKNEWQAVRGLVKSRVGGSAARPLTSSELMKFVHSGTKLP